MHGTSSSATNGIDGVFDRVKGAYSSVHGGLEVLRGNFNHTVNRAGDAVANREHGSVESRSSSDTHHHLHGPGARTSDDRTEGHNDGSDVADRGLSEMNHGLEKLTGRPVGRDSADTHSHPTHSTAAAATHHAEKHEHHHAPPALPPRHHEEAETHPSGPPLPQRHHEEAAPSGSAVGGQTY